MVPVIIIPLCEAPSLPRLPIPLLLLLAEQLRLELSWSDGLGVTGKYWDWRLQRGNVILSVKLLRTHQQGIIIICKCKPLYNLL